MKSGIIEGLDIIDVVKLIGKKNRAYQRIILSELEKTYDKDSVEFKNIRKVLLDNWNEYTRSIIRAIFGTDFEGKIE